SNFSKISSYLLNVAVDDQDHTAEWLHRGRVISAVTSLEKPVRGCRRFALGVLRFHAHGQRNFQFCIHHFELSRFNL
ncbi:hypothetical protein ACC754_44895, partial [Rhizobium johnstonii]